MGSMQFSVARPKSAWKRALEWWWVPAVPAVALVLLVIFLGINRIGNDFPGEGEPLAGGEAPAEPFEQAYVRDPELYFTVWQRDSSEGRRAMIESWQAELDELRVEVMTGDASEDVTAREQALAQAIADLRARE